MTFGQSDPLERADVAAEEDGRTPLNTRTLCGRGTSRRDPTQPAANTDLPAQRQMDYIKAWNCDICAISLRWLKS